MAAVPALGDLVDLLRPSSTPYHRETPRVQRRRRLAVVLTCVVGAALLALALSQPYGSTSFDLVALALGGAWLIGAVLSGPLHLGRVNGRRDVVGPALLGVLAFAVFAVGMLIVRQIPPLHTLVSDVLHRADVGPRVLVVAVAVGNGVAEEVFFRGALYSSFGPRKPALYSTIAYTLVTAAAGNVMLAFAAAVMGTLFSLERRSTRGVLAPMVTHTVWSTLMIFLLPR